MSATWEGGDFEYANLHNTTYSLEDVDGFDKIKEHITNLDYSPYMCHVVSGIDSHTRLNKAPFFDPRPIIKKVSSSVNKMGDDLDLGKLFLTVEVAPYYGVYLLEDKQESSDLTFPYKSIELLVKEYVPPVSFKDKIVNFFTSLDYDYF